MNARADPITLAATGEHVTLLDLVAAMIYADRAREGFVSETQMRGEARAAWRRALALVDARPEDV